MQIIIIAIGFLCFVILTQDLYIFPGVIKSKLKFLIKGNKPIPKNITSFTINPSKNKRISVWKFTPDIDIPPSKFKALIFHGNGGSVDEFLYVQMLLGEIGITSYNFDYRGFGDSTVWPSEAGINDDCDKVWEFLIKNENCTPSNTIFLGISIGTAFASRMAMLKSPKLLILVAAFTNLKAIAKLNIISKILIPFLWYKLPNNKYVSQIKSSDLFLIHGKNDNIIPYSNAEKLANCYIGSGKVTSLYSTNAGHNSVIFDLKDEIKNILKEY